ncbi:granulins-like protein [Lates japonicus]|uniref:Granulins-like protein n=1 Tax=Lates japonicus TaxID=270547 RepID=A0AAD3MQP6_LATJO|nr:granulins-like protein [Lates japonicus]
MLRITLLLLMGMCVWGFASCSITCPDGNTCSDLATCCRTKHGYSCCPYPKAVCCTDLAHCCPSGFRCNLVTQMCEKENLPWVKIPMVRKEAAEEPSPAVLPLVSLQEFKDNQVPDEEKSSVVYCDLYHYCPDFTTCCRHPGGVWFCCPYTHGRCCLDGYHCCPYGYNCDLTYTHCLRQNLWYPFSPKQPLSSVRASAISPEDTASVQEKPMTALTDASHDAYETGVIRCDSRFFCSKGTSCCKGSAGQWNCCPYPLGQCCADGQHCCEYGYTCDPSSMSCRGPYSQVPSGAQEPAKMD